jgi:segregation and condensation protein B
MLGQLKSILESLIFVSNSPLPLSRLVNLLPEYDRAEIKTALKELIDDHGARQGGFLLKEVAGGYQFRTNATHKDFVQRLLQPPPNRLSQAAMETLAIVAYKQPVIRSDIEHIRGVDCGGVLRILLERKMVRILGRREIPGRPLIYGTTRQFLEVFGLKSLQELPTPKEIESFLEPLEEAHPGQQTSASPDEISASPSLPLNGDSPISETDSQPNPDELKKP